MSVYAHLAELDPSLVAVALRLTNAGVVVTRGELGPDYFDVECETAQISVELRPPYCNRGRFIVQADSYDERVISIDWADGFPRYYFGVEACASELLAWMRARNLMPTAAVTEGER